MSAAAVVEAVEQTDLPAAADDDVTVRLRETLDWLRSLVTARGADRDLVEDAARIDRIGLCERLQAGLDAVKAVEMVAFAQSQTAEQLRLGVHPRKIGGGIADQIALACKVSPSEGSRRLHTARDLLLDMPPHPRPLGDRGDQRLDRPVDRRPVLPSRPGHEVSARC